MSIVLEAPSRQSTKTQPADRAEPGFLRIPTSAFTHAGFRAWVTSDEFPEKVRSTFVDEEIILDMSKEELTTHAFVKAEISRVLLEIVHKLDNGRLCIDGVLVSNVPAGVSNNPDAVFLSTVGLQAERFRLITSIKDDAQFVEIEGTPDWVLEIISKSSVRKDAVQLRSAYFRAGIPEYWLIDARGAAIQFEILRAGQDSYEAVPNVDGWQTSATFGKAFRLDRQQDAFGWKYELQVK